MRSVMMVAVVAVLAGCATLLAPKTSNVAMSSQPAGAEVLINGAPAGRTPVTLQLANNQEYLITFRLEGHEETTCRIRRSVGAGWVILDILGGLIPVIIDAATGAWYGLSSTACSVNLREAVGG